jgi:hypothetical protein
MFDTFMATMFVDGGIASADEKAGLPFFNPNRVRIERLFV